MPTTFPVETLTAPCLPHRFLSPLPGAERPGEWVAPRPLIWGGPPGSAVEGQSEGCLLSSCHLNCEKEIRDSGKLKVFFHEPDLGHGRLVRKSGDGTLQDTDKKCRQGHSQVRGHGSKRGGVVEGEGRTKGCLGSLLRPFAC